MSEPYPDGVPHPPTPEEIAELAKQNPALAALASAQTPSDSKEVIEKVPLTDFEAGVLLGLSVAAASIHNETQAFIASEVCRRIGIHQSKTVQFNANDKWISVRKD